MAAPTPTANRRFAGSDAPWAVLAMTLIAMLMLGVWQSPLRINHDCALYIQEAELILDGAVPYRDFVDTNPPLIMYLSMAPAALARALGVSPIPVFQVMVVLLLAICTLELYLLLLRPYPRLLPWQRGLLLLGWIASFLVADWRCEVGQREQIFVLLYVPYLFLRVLRYRGGSVTGGFAVILGLQAGVGASLKPHFFLAALVVEGVLLAASHRRRELIRTEHAAVLGVVAAYAAHWLLAPAAMREAFFGRWLPLVCRGYGAYNLSPAEVDGTILFSPIALIGLAASLVAAWFVVWSRARLRSQMLACATLTTLGLTLVLLQQKGWNYHRIPLEAAGLLCLALLLASPTFPLVRQISRITKRRRSNTLATVALLAGYLLLCGWGACRLLGWRSTSEDEPESYAALRETLQQRSRPGERVMFVNTSVRPAYPMLLQIRRQPGSRYLCSFPIAVFYHGGSRTDESCPIYRRWEEAPSEEQRFLSELQDDVAHLRPRLVVVPDFSGWLGLPRSFNIFDYLVYSGWTERALRGYRLVSASGGWRVFELTD